ncbi:Pimeloyl-ACP methyl ester carboxylesterase [Streptomyces sp. DvalAA-14]|uniref:alpha/beta fold hydrolase n=1 Tax=unclassified Streptomyces TaxID=2593676 RepID=UPI00081BC055|nr:alpha/beta hydrolase [Streptomyces sp. DvalAA-14]MYS20689.1 alpha/beta fold hydrolase [Streptomyces sp. SID4948]SCD74799.1 Pimeloyl-ACP methyl ester carboxylesterase [Streptomyces sp. DvalAA-14]
MLPTQHKTTKVKGQEVFYREAGPGDAPVVLLLHGFPSSSHMFRDLIPALADRYHVIAPDHIGFGYSSMPKTGEFGYTFDNLTEVTAGLLDQLGIKRFSVYVHDYGAPIGWRLALDPSYEVTAIVSQSGNAYMEGFADPFWEPLFAYASAPSPDTEPGARAKFTPETTRWQYENGAVDRSLVSPDAWKHDQALLERPDNEEVQLALFRDYPSNIDGYPQVQEYFRTSQVPLLAVWGEGDEIFAPDGARAFSRDLPDAEVDLLPAGHFALETHLDEITGYMRGFLGRVAA